MEEENRPTGGMQLGSEKLKGFFVKHLNIVYAIKTHLLQRLPELSSQIHYKDLYLALQEAVEDIENQISRIELVFALLDEPITPTPGDVNTSMIDDAYASIKNYHDEPELRDLAILFYLQNIEGTEMSSFQMLQMAAIKMKNPQVQQLIKENYDEAKADRTLILLIASKYLNAK